MEELQRVFMPFAVGSIAMIYSAIHSISIVNRTRYKLKDFKHPYSPWKDEQSDPTSYRAYKAQENQREWLVYTIPIYFAFCVYTPTLPYVGKYMQLVAIALSLVYGFANVQYCEAYAKDVDQRIGPFKLRTNVFKLMFFSTLASLVHYTYLAYFA